MPVVTKDATSGTWFPASSAEFTSLLSGTGIANPTNLWLSQEAAGNLADSIGTQTLTAGSVLGYNEAIAGLSRTGYRIGTGATQAFSSSAGPIGTGTDSQMVLAFVAAYGAQGVDRDIIGIQGGSGYRGAQLSAADKFKYNVNDGSAAATGTATPGTSFHPLILQIDRTNAANRIVTDQEFITQTPNTTPANVAANFFVGCAIAPGGALARVAYKAGWHGAGAELTTTQISILLDRLQNGPAISSIAISPTSATLTPAATQALVATSTRVDTSTVVNTSQAIWSSSNPSVATVNAAGVVTAVAAGTANITATFTSFGGTAATSNTSVITVTSGVTLLSIAITPSPANAVVGGTVALTATGTYSDASTANITSTVTWGHLSPSIASVGFTTGIVTGVSVGVATITATNGVVFGSDTVTIILALGNPENAHHPWPGQARGIFDHDGAQVVWTGDRMLVVRPGVSSLGSSDFWSRNVSSSFVNAPVLSMGIPAYLPLQVDNVAPITAGLANSYVETCLTETYRVVIACDQLAAFVAIDVFDRTTGVLINHTRIATTAVLNPRVMPSNGRLIATWMDAQPGALQMTFWTGSGWSTPSALVSAVSAYDTAVAIDGVHFVWRQFDLASGTYTQLAVGKLVGTSPATLPYAWGTTPDTSLTPHGPANGSVSIAVAPDNSIGIAWGNSSTNYLYAGCFTSAMVPAASTWVEMSFGWDTYGGISICSRGLKNLNGEYEWLIHFADLLGVNIDSIYPSSGLTVALERRANSQLVSKAFRVGDEVFCWLIDNNSLTTYLVGGHHNAQVCGFADRETSFGPSEDGQASWPHQVLPDPLLSGDKTGPFTITKTAGVSGGVWGSQATSVQSFVGPGYLSFSPLLDVNTQYIMGLSASDTGTSWDTVQYGMMIDGFDGTRDRCRIIESASVKFTFTYAIGDTLSIARNTAGAVTYYQNGTLLYTSTLLTVAPLIIDNAFNDMGGVVTSVTLVQGVTPLALTFNTLQTQVYSQTSGYGPKGSGTRFTWARRFNTGQTYSHPGNCRLGDIEFLPSISTATYGQGTYISGSAVRCWDGSELGDAGFQSYPIVQSTTAVAGGNLSAGDYRFRLYAVRYTKQGERMESPALTSAKITVTLNQKINVVVNCIGSTNHQDVVIEVYRTAANGGAFYLDGTITNLRDTNTVTFTTVQNDATLIKQVGDPHAAGVGAASEIVSFGPIGCGILAVCGDRLWGAGGQLPPGVVQFSKLHNDRFAAGFDDLAGYQEVDTEGGTVTSMTRMNTSMVVFEQDKLFVISGLGPNNYGAGGFNVPDIMLADGAVNHTGTVLTQVGVAYWGANGPRLLTPDYQVTNISLPITKLVKDWVPSGVRVDFTRQEVVWYTAAGNAALWNFMAGKSRWARWNGLTIAAVSSSALAVTDGRVFYPTARADASGDDGRPFAFTLCSGMISADKVIGGGTLVNAVGLTGVFEGPHTIRGRIYYNGSPCWAEEWIWEPQTGTWLATGNDYAALTPAQIDALPVKDHSGSYYTHKRTGRNHCAWFRVEISNISASGATFVPTEITLEIGVDPSLARVTPGKL